MKYQKGMVVHGAIVALTIVVAVFVIVAAYIAGQGTSVMNSAQATLPNAAIQNDGRKELQDASDKLRNSLATLNDKDKVNDASCAQISSEFEDLKYKIQSAKVKKGVGIGTAWAMDYAIKSLKEEIGEVCKGD